MTKAYGGSVYVELSLDVEQFNKDFKASVAQVAAMQKKLSLDMQRNKVRFEMEKLDQADLNKVFGSDALGKIRSIRQEAAFLNDQIAVQKDKVGAARIAWEGIASVKGATSAAAKRAEQAFLREEQALISLRKELGGIEPASAVFISAAKNGALAAAGLAASAAAAYQSVKAMAVGWGQAVNDIVDETGMADEEASKWLGVMNIVGLSGEEAAAAMAKLAKNVSVAVAAQEAARRSGLESQDVFAKYKIAIADADGSLLSHSEILENIIAVHGKMDDGLEKTAMEMEMFGKSGYKMNDFLNLSKQQLQDYTGKIEKMGLVISNSQQYENYNRSLSELGLSFKGLAVSIVGDVESLNRWTDAVIKAKKYLDELRKSVRMTDANANMVGPGAGFGLTEDEKKSAAQSQKAHDEELKRLGMKARVNKDSVKTEKTVSAETKALREDLARETLALQGRTLDAQLLEIEKERKAWKAKADDEVAVARWAEAARFKAFKDAQDKIEAGLSNYQNALKQAESARAGVGGAFQGAFGSAINEVKDNLKAGRSAGAYEAVKKLREEYELARQASKAVAEEAGFGAGDMFDPVSPWKSVSDSLKALKDAQNEADKTKIKYMETIAQNTATIAGLQSGKSAGGETGKEKEKGSSLASKTAQTQAASGQATPFANTAAERRSYNAFDADALERYPSFTGRLKANLENAAESGLQQMKANWNPSEAETRESLAQMRRSMNDWSEETKQFGQYFKNVNGSFEKAPDREIADMRSRINRTNELYETLRAGRSGEQLGRGQNLTISMPVTVQVNGMDAASAEQLGQIAAQKLYPAIERTLSLAKTSYAGGGS